MSKTIHLCLDVKGVLLNWKKKQFSKMFQHEDGSFYTADEAKRTLLDELALGHEVLPIGKCDNFDYKTGCKGHTDKEVFNIIKKGD